ncbi:class I adenylate-forming enzyme family protein [Pseudoteredinibacter isoporae]|uniref:Fatty-acyl-CoA synthase n=1 Tax=Pseudoteredinibacter isoporae TaxID=570281 RepID=A0A7X0MUF2_9GAMM|nr:AMP-binding protein [Pseudoteredinibacter isoporae]MBB6520218.1 fatty-acyl-CoA synthase [Pseudoteredinibacter isoporae]NHO85790.1 long-chain fatty acid--CoA ligase [Pseudoteredinibacter isoporae]NIB25758.1 long-chain fatty acid--CoA ligase [Pseudoteredinibacter isoporae]
MSQPSFNFKPPQFDRAYDYLYHYAQTQGEKIALVYGDERISYEDLKHRVDTLATALLERGLQSGERIACLSAPHPECIQLMLASMAIGAIWVGINPRYQLAEMQHVIDDARPKFLFSRSQMGKRDYREELTALKENHPDLQLVILNGDLKAANGQSFTDFCEHKNRTNQYLPLDSIDGESPCLIVYTSGTTGKPKGALLKQSACVRHGKLSLAQFKPEPLKVINYYPVNHVAGIVANSIYTLVGGGCNVLMEQFNPAKALETIEKESITQWGGIPTMLQLCVAHEDFSKRDLSSVQLLSWGGSAAPQTLLQTLSERVPYLSTLYAATETTGGTFIMPPNRDLDLLAQSVGQAMNDVEYRLVDEQDNVVSDGNVGELQLKGPFCMLEYWGQEEATRDTYSKDGWLKTGDLAKQDNNGNLFLIGRSKEMYKSGGFNVYPREVEQAIEDIDGVDMIAVVSVPDELYGEVGHAYITSKANSQLSEESLREDCRQRLANYKIPKAFHLLNHLPLLANGKIDKKQLQANARAIAEHSS